MVGTQRLHVWYGNFKLADVLENTASAGRPTCHLSLSLSRLLPLFQAFVILCLISNIQDPSSSGIQCLSTPPCLYAYWNALCQQTKPFFEFWHPQGGHAMLHPLSGWQSLACRPLTAVSTALWPVGCPATISWGRSGRHKGLSESGAYFGTEWY